MWCIGSFFHRASLQACGDTVCLCAKTRVTVAAAVLRSAVVKDHCMAHHLAALHTSRHRQQSGTCFIQPSTHRRMAPINRPTFPSAGPSVPVEAKSYSGTVNICDTAPNSRLCGSCAQELVGLLRDQTLGRQRNVGTVDQLVLSVP
jgi:hypothetical protein